jgi:hypothetical protein
MPGKFTAAMPNSDSENRVRDFFAVLAVWMLLAVTLIFLAWPNTAVPGLYYDEAHCAGMARDFLTGHPHPHMPGSSFVSLWGRPLPAFVQIYDGALKSWLLLPGFAVFGARLSVLRLSALGWGLGALLLFMLWTWRWLGRNTALFAGALLAFDPAFFFISVLDWGPVLPGFLCRFACFYFGLRWWQLRNETPAPDDAAGEPPPEKLRSVLPAMFFRGLTFLCFHRGSFFAFLAGLFAGLGFFNKIDFAILLAGVVLALLCRNARPLWDQIRLRRFPVFAGPFALAGLGFVLAAGPMLLHLPAILHGQLSQSQPGSAPGELAEKCNTMRAMYDGSYFYRLMDAGGLFDRMYQAPAPVFAPVGIACLLAAASLLFSSSRKKAVFPLLAILFITIGLFLLPGAVRIHHMVLVYPFPHLVVALAVARFWPGRRRAEPGSAGPNALVPSSALAAALFVLLLASQLLAFSFPLPAREVIFPRHET